MFAAFRGHTDTVQTLLGKGADINAKSNNNVTALIFAVSEGHISTVKALLAKGADINVKDINGNTEWQYRHSRITQAGWSEGMKNLKRTSKKT
jgi:ankyrin repeat protein